MIRELAHYIGGHLVAGRSGRFGDVYDPNLGKVQARVPLARSPTEHGKMIRGCLPSTNTATEWRSSPATATPRDFASKVDVGMVGVSVPIPLPIACHTFGGRKCSGFGDLHQHGPDSIRFDPRTKTVKASGSLG